MLRKLRQVKKRTVGELGDGATILDDLNEARTRNGRFAVANGDKQTVLLRIVDDR